MYQITLNDFILSSYDRDSQLVINDKRDSVRIRAIKRHIKADDYLGTLATILDLMKQIMVSIEQGAKDIEGTCKKNSKRLEKLRDDLMFLQENYKFTKK